MEQAVRALSWAIRLFWIMLIIFSVTAAHSLIMLLDNVEILEPKFSISNGDAIVTLPCFINNTGYYSMSDFNITTYIIYEDKDVLCKSTSYEELIPKRSALYRAHNMTINLNQTIINHSNLLFNDTHLNMQTLVHLKFARVIPFQIAFNQTTEWGAPLYNFTVHQILYNETTTNITLFFSYENHAFMDLKGTIQVQLYNDSDNQIGIGETNVNTPPHSYCQESMEFRSTANPVTGKMHFYFQTETFSFGPKVIPYG
jgi:hypothetical protein